MDIKKITDICNAELNPEIKEHLIINILADDENILPTITAILESERKKRKSVLSDMNSLLSKSHLAFHIPRLNKDNLIENEIIEFYKKNKGVKGVHYCFKHDEL